LSPDPASVGDESDLGTGSSNFSPLSLPRQGQVQTEPVNVRGLVLDVRALGFPREFGFRVRRRGVVVSGLGTVPISVGTLSQGSRHSVVCKLTAHGVLSRGLIIRAVPDGPACGANPRPGQFIVRS